MGIPIDVSLRESIRDLFDFRETRLIEIVAARFKKNIRLEENGYWKLLFVKYAYSSFALLISTSERLIE